MLKLSAWEEVGSCDVDAGCVMLMDPCYTFPNTPYVRDAEQQEKNFGEEWYEAEICKDFDQVARPIRAAGTMGSPGGSGVLVQSGYGDGTYPVYVRKNSEGRIAEVKIVFIGEDEDDDYWH
jgi:hypothetical protein